MAEPYRATGINLKTIPLGEADRIVTILTQEQGLVRAVAKGARKPKSKLGGRTEPFVVNTLLIAPGRSLDRITQADLSQSFNQLRRSMAKLTAAQYWAEIVLSQAVAAQPQADLFMVLLTHLGRLDEATPAAVLPLLSHGIYHLLAIAGVAPQVQGCPYCQTLLSPEPYQDVAFSPVAGGVICEACLVAQRPKRVHMTTGSVLTAMQLLTQPTLPPLATPVPSIWLGAERLLRATAQYHFDRDIRAATLVESCVVPRPVPNPV